jgi:predicted ATP-binding protein involved in virulence
LPTISEALPNIQFIVTTHSPIVVGSLQRENITVLNAHTAGTESKQLPESVHGKSAEQILLSPYFGLDSTRAPDVAKKLTEIRKNAERGDKRAGLAYLKMLTEGKL